MTILNLPFLNPIKFYKNGDSGIHFDSDWMYNRIMSFETKVQYYQKWQVGDSTKIQVEATIMPSLEIHDCLGLKKTIAFTKVADGAELGVNIYEATINLDDQVVNKNYYAYLKAVYGDSMFEAISEPIKLQTTWPGTLLFSYKNSDNNFGVAFTTGIEFSFRCEAGIMDFNPESEDSNYVDQIHNVEELSGTPFRTFKLYIGDAKGVAPWVLDLLNRIFVCDHVEIEGMQYAKNTGAKWEINRVKPWPLYGGNLEIIPSQNASGLQFIDDADVSDGLVTAYDIDTNFFGTTTDDEHIIDITIE